ncbi:MAG: zf-HC2 domain-containing protein [Acidobacteriota bacterium]
MRHKLITYLDRELAPEETLHIERHLRTCAECAERERLERAFTRVLRQRLVRETAPDWLMPRVQQALAREVEARRRPAWFGFGGWRLALAGSGYALAALLGVLWLSGQAPPFQIPEGAQRQPAARAPWGVSGPGAAQVAGSWVPVSMQVQGVVVCAGCEKVGVPLEQHPQCDRYGHFNGVRAADGRLWLLVQDQGQNSILQDRNMRGRAVRVLADAFENVEYLIARNVHTL